MSETAAEALVGRSDYRSPILALPGAVPVPEGPDMGVALHYGDPLREQRRLVAGEGFVDLSHRGVLRVSGPERLSWLHSLTSQHLSQLEPGVGTEALVLSPHGHVEAHMRVLDDGTSTWLTLEPGTGAGLRAYLESMRFWAQVEVADLSDEVAVLWQPRSSPQPGLLSWVCPPRGGFAGALAGRELLVPRDRLEAVLSRAGQPAGLWSMEALRLAAASPRFGFETDHRTIPHEVGWIGAAVHLDKGCYRGQETVARVHNLGRPPRRLVLLHLDGSTGELPGHAAVIEHEGRPVGVLGTAVHHFELGPIGLGLVRRSVPTEATLHLGRVSAAQEVVVPA